MEEIHCYETFITIQYTTWYPIPEHSNIRHHKYHENVEEPEVGYETRTSGNERANFELFNEIQDVIL
jgi:hypothetical protein